MRPAPQTSPLISPSPGARGPQSPDQRCKSLSSEANDGSAAKMPFNGDPFSFMVLQTGGLIEKTCVSEAWQFEVPRTIKHPGVIYGLTYTDFAPMWRAYMHLRVPKCKEYYYFDVWKRSNLNAARERSVYLIKIVVFKHV